MRTRRSPHREAGRRAGGAPRERSAPDVRAYRDFIKSPVIGGRLQNSAILRAHLRARLEEEFDPDVAVLSELLGCDLTTLWLRRTLSKASPS